MNESAWKENVICLWLKPGADQHANVQELPPSQILFADVITPDYASRTLQYTHVCSLLE